MKTIYTMRIVLSQFIAFLLGAAIGHINYLPLICLIIGLTITSFFVYESMAYDQLYRKEWRIYADNRSERFR